MLVWGNLYRDGPASKPMVEIGGKPILLHIMEWYASHGVTDFLICAGYRANYLKSYFVNYNQNLYDIKINTATNEIGYFNRSSKEWTITIIDTGLETMTGGRIKRIAEFVKEDPFFHMTYGDGVADIDIKALEASHLASKGLATLTAVSPMGRFGALTIDKSGSVTKFEEKADSLGSRINGGFFVLDPKVIDYIHGDDTVWEQAPLRKLAEEGNLHSYDHDGFWHPMDTLRDKNYLNQLIESNEAPWVI